MPAVFIRTWGCTLNQSDGDIMAALLEREGFAIAGAEGEADAIVLNTCTVKGATESKIISELRRLRGGGAKVVVAGCLAADEKRVREAAPGVPIVGAGATSFICEAVRHALRGEGGTFSGIGKKYGLPRKLGAPIARIPIGEGCAGKCKFCQTRIARPILMSYPPKEVLRLVEEAVGKGAREIRLTAMDTGAYGMDLGADLVALLEELMKVEGDFRMRLGMINPEHARRMGAGLAGIFRSPRMYKFLHIPVQSGSEKVCADMGRAHTVADFELAVKDFRKGFGGITVATDIIVGYPTESGEDFALTLEMLERARPDVVNLSKFTPRPGTEAKGMRQLPTQILKERARRAHALVRGIAEANAQEFVGRRMGVLINEEGAEGQMKGRAWNYRQVVVKGGMELMGREVEVEIEKASHSSLFGKIARD